MDCCTLNCALGSIALFFLLINLVIELFISRTTTSSKTGRSNWPNGRTNTSCSCRKRRSWIKNGFRLVLRKLLENLDPQPRSIQDLPPEIINSIIEFLPPSGALSLSYTCRHFHAILPHALESLFLQKRNASLNEDRYLAQERRTFLNFRNRTLHSSDFFLNRQCVRCKRRPPLSHFSLAAVRGPSRERQCLSCEGYFWLCPSKKRTFKEILDLQLKSKSYPATIPA